MPPRIVASETATLQPLQLIFNDGWFDGRQVNNLVPSRMIVCGHIGERVSALFATVRPNRVPTTRSNALDNRPVTMSAKFVSKIDDIFTVIVRRLFTVPQAVRLVICSFKDSGLIGELPES